MTLESGFSSVEGRGQAEVEIKRSRFIGHAAPAETVEVAEQFIEEINTAFDEATHNVPAYRIRIEVEVDTGYLREWSSDAGEPTGSAGKPVLNVLCQRDLEDIVVVVTRYFGGTELGVGGLARTYAKAASAAVDAGGVIDRLPQTRLIIVVEYSDSGTVRGILESEDLGFAAEYTEDVRFSVQLSMGRKEAVCDRIQSATSGRAQITTEEGIDP